MKGRSWQDKDIVNSIRKGGQARKDALHRIYSNTQLRHEIVGLVISKKGTRQDGEDILHDGMIVLDRSIRQGKFMMTGTIKKYLVSICHFLWQNRMRKMARIDLRDQVVEDKNTADDRPDESLISQQKMDLLEQLLDKMDAQCIKILSLWKQAYSMREIANLVGLSSPSIAKKYRYRCKQKMIRLLEEDPQLLAALKEVK